MTRSTRILCIAGILFVAVLIHLTPAGAAGDILIITHPDVQAESLNADTAAEIYKARRTKWDNGDTIRVVMLKSGETHDTFAQNIVNTTSAKLKQLWKKVVFTGAGTPPKILKNETDMIEFVAENEGAIGYIDASTPHDGVKVITLSE